MGPKLIPLQSIVLSGPRSVERRQELLDYLQLSYIHDQPSDKKMSKDKYEFKLKNIIYDLEQKAKDIKSKAEENVKEDIKTETIYEQKFKEF